MAKTFSFDPPNESWGKIGGNFDKGSNIAVVSWGVGRLDIFGMAGGSIWLKSWDNASGWNPKGQAWNNLGGNFDKGSSIAAVSWGVGRLDIFGMAGGSIWLKSWDNASGWNPKGQAWNNLGGSFDKGSNIAAVSWGSGRFDVFGMAGGSIWLKSWDNASGWNPKEQAWNNLGGNFDKGSSIAAVSWGVGRLDLFGLTADNAMWHRSSILPAPPRAEIGNEYILTTGGEPAENTIAAIPPNNSPNNLNGKLIISTTPRNCPVMLQAELKASMTVKDVSSSLLNGIPMGSELGFDNQITRLSNGDLLAARLCGLTTPISPKPVWSDFRNPPYQRNGYYFWKSADYGKTWQFLSYIDAAKATFRNPDTNQFVEVGSSAFPQEHSNCMCAVDKDSVATGRHNIGSSGNYYIPTTLTAPAVGQKDWKFCSKCYQLFYTGISNGVCSSGGEHVPETIDPQLSKNFTLCTDKADPLWQKGWKHCKKCQCLYFGEQHGGYCPAGGNHDGSTSGNYSIRVNNGPGNPSDLPNWRWCSKCQGMLYSPLALFFGGWDRCDVYVDPWDGTVYANMSSDSGSESLGHYTYKSLLFRSLDGAKTWSVDDKGNTAAIQTFSRFQPLAITSTKEGQLFIFHPVGVYVSNDKGKTIRTYDIFTLPDVPKSGAVDLALIPAHLRNNAIWSISRAGDGVRIAYTTIVDGRQVISIVFMRWPKSATQPEVHLIAQIEAKDSTGHCLYFAFIEADRVELSKENLLDVAILYWVESSGSKISTRYCVCHGVDGCSQPADLSASSWQPAGDFDIGDYIKGAFYYDGNLNYVCLWPQRNSTSVTLNYRIVTVTRFPAT